MDDAGSWLKQAEYSTYFNPEGFDAAKRVVRMPYVWLMFINLSTRPFIPPPIHVPSSV
jgi:hypothetical protein